MTRLLIRLRSIFGRRPFSIQPRAAPFSPWSLASALALSVSLLAAGSAAAQNARSFLLGEPAGPPESVVRQAYALETRRLLGGEPGAVPWSAAYRGRFFSQRLRQLLANDDRYAARRLGVGRLTFDPFWGAGDAEARSVALETETTEPRKAIVTATFMMRSERRRVTFTVLAEDALWRIDEIAGENARQGAWTLSQVLAAPE